MKRSIIRNHNVTIETSILLLENKNLKEGPISGIQNIYNKLKPTDQQRINKAIIQKIADLFENPFAKYLEKHLNSGLKTVDLGSMINKAQNGDKDQMNKLKSFLLDSMLDYYESLLKNKLFKKSLTGDKTIDEAYSRAIVDLFNTPDIIDIFYKNIDYILTDKENEIEDLEINEASKAKTVYRYMKSVGKRSKMRRYKISDKLLSYIPNVDRKLKRYIHNLVMNMDGKMFDKLHSKWDIRNVANALSEPIIGYIHAKIQNKYIDNNPDLKFFNNILKGILSSDRMESLFRTELLRLFNLKSLSKI